MADSIVLPPEVEKTIEVKVRDTSASLRKFLAEMANRMMKLENRVKALEDKVSTL